MKINNFNKINEIENYFCEIKNFHPLSKEEENLLSEEIKKGNQNAIERLVTSNLKFVVNIAKSYRNSGVPFSDLISEGNIGLIKAAQKFDSKKDVRFISYAVWWVKNSIQDCINEYQNNYTENSGIEDYVFENCTNTDYVCNNINDDFENELINIQSRKDSINELMSCLQQREIKILMEYFGIKDGKEKTLDEISNELQITNERVRQIKDNALIKLRTYALTSNEFETYKNLR